MSLAGLLTVVDDDPQLQVAVSRAEAGSVAEPASPPGAAADGQATTLAGEDLVAPPTLRPVLAAALAHGAHGGAPRFVLAVTATAREADDLAAALGSFLPPDSVACFPGWETLPHERLSPRSGHRGAADRRAPAARPPGGRRRAERAAGGRGVAGQEPAAADRGRPRRPRAGRAAGRPGLRSRRPARQAGRDRLLPGRHGREPRRDRRAGRHRRRVPAHRGTPAAGRVLRRHGRGDPLLQGRRPAQHRPGRATVFGRRRAASCCSPRRSGSGPRNSPTPTRPWPTSSASWPRG